MNLKLTDVIYNNDALNKSEIAVLLYLTTFINNEGTCSVSHAQIANATKYDKRTVQRTISDLLRKNHLLLITAGTKLQMAAKYQFNSIIYGSNKTNKDGNIVGDDISLAVNNERHAIDSTSTDRGYIDDSLWTTCLEAIDMLSTGNIECPQTIGVVSTDNTDTHSRARYIYNIINNINNYYNYNNIYINKSKTKRNSCEVSCEVKTSPLAVSEEISCSAGILLEVPKLAVKPTSAACQEVFAHWQTVMNYSSAKLDKIRKKVIDAALKDFEVADLKKAIDGCAKSPFFMGTNDRHTKYNGIKVIFGRGAERIEHFIEVAKGNSHEYKPSYEI